MEKTRPLDRFWRALETVPGLSLIQVEWEEKLGPDFETCRRYLRPTGQQASAYPCPRPGGVGCPRQVVVHGPGDIVAVCRDDPPSCDAVALKETDLVAYEVHLAKLCGKIADALGIEGHLQKTADSVRTWSLGAHLRRPGERLPVYLSLPLREEHFRQAAAELIAACTGPFVLLTPRSHHAETGTIDLIQRDGSVYLALAEILRLSEDGLLVAQVRIADLLDEPREIPEPAPYVFSRRGHFWEAVYQGEARQLKDTNGLRYLQELLRNPGREFLPELLPTETGESPPPGLPGRLDGSSAEVDRILDPRAKAEYQRRLEDITSELAEAEGRHDLVAAEKLRDEKEKVVDELTRAFGLGGRPRRVRNPRQRARDRVTKALRRSLLDIEKEHPNFFKHLDASLRRKGTWAYCPESELPWVF